MTLQDLGAIGELIGAIAVVATLVYLAMQLRLNAQMNRALIRQGLADALSQATATGIDDPSFSKILHKADLFLLEAETEPMNDEERSRFCRFLLHVFRVYENIYLQYQAGLYDESEWLRTRRGMLHFLTLPRAVDVVDDFWTRVQFAFDDRFVAEINALKADA